MENGEADTSVEKESFASKGQAQQGSGTAQAYSTSGDSPNSVVGACKYMENKTDFVRAVLCALLISMLFSFVISERDRDNEQSGIPRGLSVQYAWDDCRGVTGTITYSSPHYESRPIPTPQKQCLYCRDTGVLLRQRHDPDTHEFLKLRHERFALLWIVFYFVYLVGDYIHPLPSRPRETAPLLKQFFKRLPLCLNPERIKLPLLVLGCFLFLMQAYHVEDLKTSAYFGIAGLVCTTSVVFFEKRRNKAVIIVWVIENIAMISAMLCYLCNCGCHCALGLTAFLIWGMPLAAILLSWLTQDTNTKSQGDNTE